MDLDEYQHRAHSTANTDDLDVYSLGLIGEAGSVASSIKKMKRDKTPPSNLAIEISTELGDVLWYVAELATRSNLKLSDIAEYNLQKTHYLFNDDDSSFDQGFPPDQKLPDKMEFEFISQGNKVSLLMNGKPIGDPIDDNAWNDDFYRFHDIFHVAYATILGWSPVIRKLAELKRKDDKSIDRIEDGARAVFLEEGISIAVFTQNVDSGQVSFFSDPNNIPFSVIEMVKLMTSKQEVNRRGVDAWRKAISEGFRLFDELRRNNGGIVACDRVEGALTFRPRT
jgi:NTP pyrophosphatase (non-canonical NTP hydrolase)